MGEGGVAPAWQLWVLHVSLYMCMYMYVCMVVDVCTLVSVYIRASLYMHLYEHAHVCTYVLICMYYFLAHFFFFPLFDVFISSTNLRTYISLSFTVLPLSLISSSYRSVCVLFTFANSFVFYPFLDKFC